MEFTIFGVKEMNKINSEDDLHLENISINGYTIIENVHSQSDLEYARVSLDKLYEKQIEEVGSEEALFLINDAYNVRAPLVYDEFFLTQIAANKRILQIVKLLMGDYYILMLQNGVFNMPKTLKKPNAYAYHRDLNYQHFVSSRPLSISALHCIDDFNEHTGGTIVLPYTHKIESCPSLEYISKNEVQVKTKAGSVILFDSMMFHRSGVNLTSNVRRGINNANQE